MILKVEMLLDSNSIVGPQEITALLGAVFKDNSHLAKIILCEVSEAEKKHNWRWYTNGTFCLDCGQPLGTHKECR